MKRYLKVATMLVFISGESSVKRVIKCLEDYKIRNEYIENVQQNEELRGYILALRELDERNKHGEVIGSKTTNKTDALKDNVFMDLMYNQDYSNNINFIKEPSYINYLSFVQI